MIPDLLPHSHGRRVPLYRIRKAAELSGVPEPLIRAWERRYGFLKPRRSASGYRSYDDDEVELLRQVKKLTTQGIPIGDAVKQAPAIRQALREAPGAPQRVAPGQTVVDSWKARVLAGAETFSQQDVERVLDEALASVPAVSLYEQLVVPSLKELGLRWQQGALCTAQEHLVTQVFRTRFLGLLQRSPGGLGRRHAVCACLAQEDHELGLIGAALRLHQGGYRITYLGARTPPHELSPVVQGSHANVVALSIVNDEGRKSFRAVLKAAMQGMPSFVRVIAGGAAADKYADVCDALGVSRIASESDWTRVLTSER